MSRMRSKSRIEVPALFFAILVPLSLLLTTLALSAFPARLVRDVNCTVLQNAHAPGSCTVGLAAPSPLTPKGAFAKPCRPTAQTIAIGSLFTASATLQNDSASTLAIRDAALTTRPSDGERLDGPYENLSPEVTNVTIPPGESITVTGSRQMAKTDRVGTWICYLTFQTLDYVWHDGQTVTQFTVKALAFAQSCQPTPSVISTGGTITASAAMQNGTGAQLAVSRLLITFRPPGGTNAGGLYLNMEPVRTDVLIDPGETVRIQGSLTVPIAGPPGSWYCYLTYQTADGAWHDDPVTAAFTVQAAVVAPAHAIEPTPTGVPNPTDADPAGFISSRGEKLMYKGTELRLRGENFNNEPGLACCGGPNIRGIDANEADYVKMRSLGANSIRLGMDYGWYQADRTGFFSTIDAQVGYARANRLWVILNLYTPPGGSSGGFEQYALWGNQRNNDLLNTFWSDVALHYSRNSTVAGYDLLNEPAPHLDRQWVDLSGRLYRTVRLADANHLVVIEAPLSNDLGGFSLTDHVLYSVHHYAGGDNYPSGRPSGTPLWVGEFGQTSDGSAVQFVRSEIARYESDGVSWCHFVEREASGFGLFGSYVAGDFSSPWTAMIAAVQAGFAGSVLP